MCRWGRRQNENAFRMAVWGSGGKETALKDAAIYYLRYNLARRLFLMILTLGRTRGRTSRDQVQNQVYKTTY